jgi:RNA polymerase sigma-70 factor (sigma-E family)
VLTHGPELLRFARRLTLDYHRGEDVVQEVLARAAGSWARIRSFDNIRAYLFKCVLNETLSWRRRRGAGELVNITLVDEIVGVGPSFGFEDQVLQRDQLRTALAELSAVQRAVVVLRYYQDLPDAEIAELLGCPPSTVRSHAARALTKLRGAINLEPSREGRP